MASTYSKVVRQLQAERAALSAQLGRIMAAITALGGGAGDGSRRGRGRKRGRKAGGGKRRKFSAATIAKMRRAQRARWKKIRAEKAGG